MTNLKEVNFGVNQYCVPAVMSALTGRSTDECAAVISSINGKKEIKAVNTGDIIKAFEKLRFVVEPRNVPGSTLYGVLNRLVITDGLYLVMVPKHIVAIRIEEGNILICDNQTRSPIDAKASARLTQKVERVYKITPKPQPVYVKSIIRLTYLTSRVNIYKDAIYEDVEDNLTYPMGHIYYKDIEELQAIVDKLTLLAFGEK